MEQTADREVVERPRPTLTAAANRPRVARDLRDAQSRRHRARKRRRTQRNRAITAAIVTFVIAHVFVWTVSLKDPGSWPLLLGVWVIAGVGLTVALWPEPEYDDPTL